MVLNVTFHGAGVEVLRVQPGEVPQRLRAQDEVQQQPAGEREDDQALGVRLPVLALVGVDAQHPVQEPLGAAAAAGRGTCARRCRPRPCSGRAAAPARSGPRRRGRSSASRGTSWLRTSLRAAARTAGRRTRAPRRPGRTSRRAHRVHSPSEHSGARLNGPGASHPAAHVAEDDRCRGWGHIRSIPSISASRSANMAIPKTIDTMSMADSLPLPSSRPRAESGPRHTDVVKIARRG